MLAGEGMIITARGIPDDRSIASAYVERRLRYDFQMDRPDKTGQA